MQAAQETQNWFLMKHEDGSVFGPIPFNQLQRWAVDAQISPLDKVSTDESNWFKAPMIPELAMDFLIEVSPDQYYGPTTLGAVSEFITMGEIGTETIVINCRDGAQQTVKDIPGLVPPAPAKASREDEQPVRTSIRLSLQQRIRDLEETLLEERRAREVAEARCEKMEAKLAEFGVHI
jgi:hypothetical protein